MPEEQHHHNIPNDILIVDDTIPNLQLLSELLSGEGYQVRPANNPQLAIDSALEHPPKLILLDVKMPEIDGFEVCKRLKQDARIRDVPILFISALQDAQDKVQGFEAGGVDFISKPFQKEEVLARVRTHMNLRDMQINMELIVAQRTAKLLESELRFRATFEQAAVGIAHVSVEGKFLRVNTKFCDIVGYSRDEILDVTFQEITHPDDLDTDLEHVQQLLKGTRENYSLDKRYIRKDGSVVWVNLTVSLLIDRRGNPKYFVAVINDISERKEAEDALHEREATLSILLNAPLEVIMLLNRDGTVLSINEGGASRFGKSPEALIGHNIYQNITGEAAQLRKHYGEEVFTTGKIVQFEDNREDTYFINSVYPVFDAEDEKVISIAVFSSDITERKKAEESLANSESKYRSLVDNSMVGVFSSNLKGEFLFVNKAMVEMYDFDSPEHMLAKGSLPRWVDQKRREQMLAELKQHGSVTNFEAETITNAGRHIYVLFSAKMFGENIFGMVMDITDRKKMVEELEISRANLIKAQEVGHTGSWNLDLLENNLVWTDEVYKIFGIPIGTLVTYKKFLAKVHPEDRDYVHRKWSAAIEGEPYDIEHRLLVGNEVKWVREKSELSFDDKGNPKAGIGITQDITERKQAEAELTKSYKEIEKLQKQLQAESTYLQEEIKLEHNFENIIGQSETLKYVLHRVEQVAPQDSTVLILGETGTGKELIARALHQLSSRSKRPLVKVNCATLPGELIESELFGREKGAFTGATSTQIGRFELAHESTLFLDEIGEIPLALQAKLLRVLESGEFERLGSSRTLKSDVRIIAATNRNLQEEVRENRFREDLLYRLNIFPISLPPLRDRVGDIPLLVQEFIQLFSRKMGKPNAVNISKNSLHSLQSYSWPGNVRELKHVVESAFISAHGDKLHFDIPQTADVASGDLKSLEEMEREYILSVLKAKNWKISGEDGAASILVMPPSTLSSRIKKLGLKRPWY